jgi:UDP-N-acetylglucosamine 1-carboxyvinyltransferase
MMDLGTVVPADTKTAQHLEIIGGRKLYGSVKVSGAKNAVLKLMTASLLTNNLCIIRNVPRIKDVEIINAYICP